MPTRFYLQRCAHATSGSLTAGERCRVCGAENEFVGWQLSMHEAMARYQYVYGVPPMGPHRGMTDDILGSKRVKCDACQGLGIRTVDIDRWRYCGACEGTGGFWSCPPKEVEKLRRIIIERYPAADVARPSRFVGEFARNLKTGEVVRLDELDLDYESDTEGK